MNPKLMTRLLSSFLIVTLIFTVLLFSSCETRELEVTYLFVPTFDVEGNGMSGDVSTNITDVRVVIGAESLGFYPLPARIPILASGEHRIRLEPVVRIAGLSANRTVYPFYEVFEETLDLVPGTIDTIRPTISYVSTSSFGYVEDFETNNASLILDLDDFSETQIERSTDSPSLGSGAGVATLTRDANILEVASPVINSTGQAWNRIWVEVDYKGTVPLALALIPETPGPDQERLPRFVQGISSTEQFIKIYFEVVANSQQEFASAPFRLAFLAVLDSTETANISVDNIKVVHQNPL